MQKLPHRGKITPVAKEFGIAKNFKENQKLNNENKIERSQDKEFFSLEETCE